MKKMIAAVVVLVLVVGFIPACEVNQTTIRFRLKVPDLIQMDYYICAENQDVKVKLDLEHFNYVEDPNEAGYRIYDVTAEYPAKVTVREDGRTFWTIYMGYISENSETFSDTLKNIGIRGENTVVEFAAKKVLYDTVQTIYGDEKFTLFCCNGMETKGALLYDAQIVWIVKNGERENQGTILPEATIQLLGENAPDSNGDVETWFSVISGAESVGEVDRFCVTIKGTGQPECALTLADLPDVISEGGTKWLDDAEFASDGIKPNTDAAEMKTVFGEPVSSWGEYGNDAEYQAHQYDGVMYQFYSRFFNGDEWIETDRALFAEFTKNLQEFPRGIQIGDRFEDVLKKFPQEMDYKDDKNEGMFYGDYWRKDKLGWGAVHIANNNGNSENGVWMSVICDEYWPMLKVHFSDELIADKIVIQFSPTPYYN